jgi:hypothetical protein
MFCRRSKDVWCGLNYRACDQPDFADRAITELVRCQKAGARGVGELIDKGGGLTRNAGNAAPLHIDDPRLDPILEKCAELHLLVNVHVGEDRWMYEPMDQTNDGLMNAFTWKVLSPATGCFITFRLVCAMPRSVLPGPPKAPDPTSKGAADPGTLDAFVPASHRNSNPTVRPQFSQGTADDRRSHGDLPE